MTQTQDTPLVARVPILNRSREIRDYALVDIGDLVSVGHIQWHLGSRGYARSHIPGDPTVYLMHRVILRLSPGDGRLVDHINRNRLDNRRANLRIADHALNMRNKGPRGSRAALGIYHDKDKRLWRARVRLHGKAHHIGYFRTEADASEAANAWTKIHIPERWQTP